MEIIVKNRKEFIKLFREIFIPHCVDNELNELFNIGYSLNNWDMFWVYDNKSKTETLIKLEI